MLALEFAMDDRPIRFGNAPVALLLARVLIEQRLQLDVAQFLWKRPGQARRGNLLGRLSNRRSRNAHAACDLPLRQAAHGQQPDNLAQLAHLDPLRRQRSLPRKRGTLKRVSRAISR